MLTGSPTSAGAPASPGWFCHTAPDASVSPARTAPAIPADAVGFASISVASPDPTYAVSLQMALHIHADPVPLAGWIGIGSTDLALRTGIVSGITHLWDPAGRPLATDAQTASMLRVPTGAAPAGSPS